jgi:hypothetical protein
MKKTTLLKTSLWLVLFVLVLKVNAQTLTIGSGTTQSGATVSSPINNDYESHHCQILYTAAEINAGGLSTAGTITQLGFYVTTAPANSLPNFTIKMKNTSATNAVTYDGNALTQVHTIASYMPGTGSFHMLSLNTPFVWDGVSNLLVDVCFDVAAGSGGSGRVRVFTPSPAGTHYSYTRNSVAQCGVPTNADDGNFNDFGTRASKPQVRFIYTAAPGCVTPAISSLSSLSATGVTINWTAPNPAPANGYHWKVVAAGSGTAGVAVASGNTAAGTTSASATGLSGNTAYDIYVWSDCGGSGLSTYSAPYSFSTLCLATNIPYTVNLAAVTVPALPTCTSAEKLNAGNNWVTYAPGGGGFNGNALAYIYNSTSPADAWFYTQGLNMTAGTSYRLSYKYANDGGTTYPERMNVSFGASASAAAMTNTLTDHPNITGAVNPFIATVDFVPPSTGVYYIGFHAYSLADEDVLLVDSVNVTLSPSCIEPSNVSISTIMATSANVLWTIPAGTPANFNWDVRDSGTPGTAGAAASGTVSASTSSVNANGLTPNTTYSVYVRTDCGSGTYSAWTLAQVFTTPCNATNIPYIMDFASLTVPAIPNCTSIQTISGNSWETMAGPGNGFNTNTLVYPYNGSQAADSWVYTQGLNLTAGTAYRLSYKYANDGGTSYPEKMNVNYGTSPIASAMTNTLANHPNITGVLTPLIDVIDFVAPSTGVYYIGFHAYSDADMDVLLLDSVIVDLAPSCVSPTALTLSGLTSASVNVSWAAPIIGTPANYDWEIRTSGTPGTAGATASGTVAVPTVSANATGLAPNTTYTLYVRTDCGAGSFSGWTSLVFTTPCNATNIPYIMDFASLTAPALPSCTSVQTLNSGNTWETENAPGYGFTGNALVYGYNSTNPADTWLYTQGLNLTAGTAYKLAYRYNAAGTTYVEDMNVNFGTAPSAAAMTNTLTLHTSITNSTTPYVDVISFTPSATGVYYIGFHAFSAADQFNLYVDSINVTLCSAPAVSATASSTLVCSNFGESAVLTASTTATTYSWSNGDATMSTTVTPTTGTTYTLTVTDAVCNLSASTTIFVDAQICMAVNNQTALGNAVSLYPNPTNGIVSIAIPLQLSGVTSVEIYDAIGKLVISEKLSKEVSTINTSKLEDGIYLFRIINNNQAVKVGRMIKQ